MKLVMIILVGAFNLYGCDYRPRETFTIPTVNGKQIHLTCPVVNSDRSIVTYWTDGNCVVEPNK